MKSCTEKIVLLIAHESLTYNMLNTYNLDCVYKVYDLDYSGVFSMGVDSVNIWDDKFWIEKRNAIAQIRNNLVDKESKEALDAFVWQRRSLEYFKSKSEGQQYFPLDILSFEENEIMIDCGGYIGDTSMDYYSLMEQLEYSKWKSFILEPDEENAIICTSNMERYDATIYSLGAWIEKATLSFSEKSSSESKIEDAGSEVINVDSIDNLFYGLMPTFIKMDIEGTEMMALKGAKRTIQNYKPKLAISCYHRKSDLFDIYEYLRALVPEYKYALRNYSTCSLECILYAYI